MRQNWYILYTKPQCEKKVAQALTAKGFTSFCPLNKVSSWYEQKKEAAHPIFTSYVFVKTSVDHHRSLKEINGVVGLVYWLDAPAVIQDHEIEMIRHFVNQYQNIKLHPPGLHQDWNGVSPRHSMDMNIDVQNQTAKVFIASLGKMMYGESRVSTLEINHTGVPSSVPALQFS